jgi:hypothetical protein
MLRKDNYCYTKTLDNIIIYNLLVKLLIELSTLSLKAAEFRYNIIRVKLRHNTTKSSSIDSNIEVTTKRRKLLIKLDNAINLSNY